MGGPARLSMARAAGPGSGGRGSWSVGRLAWQADPAGEGSQSEQAAEGIAAWYIRRRRGGRGAATAVLLKIYRHCIDGQADAANHRVTDALGIEDPSPATATSRRLQRVGSLKWQASSLEAGGRSA
jgi:hypothetical protein